MTIVLCAFNVGSYVTHACQLEGAQKDGKLTLQQYVNTPDPTYSFREVKRTEGLYHTAYYINMTSQKWMDGENEIVLVICSKIIAVGC